MASDSASAREFAAGGTIMHPAQRQEAPEMEETLLELLCAPLSHAALRLAGAIELGQINSRIQQRLIRNRDGLILDTELDGSLLCETDRTCYPIRDGMPVLTPGEAFDWPPNP